MREGAGGGGTGATHASLGRLQVLDSLYHLWPQVVVAACDLAPMSASANRVPVLGHAQPELVDLFHLAQSQAKLSGLALRQVEPVSYTHLTLPTTAIV